MHEDEKDPHATQRFGAHMSIAGGLENALEAARRAGCDCLQVFVKNQRQWRAAPLRAAQVAAFREAQRQTRIAPVVAHASYLINLASPNRAARRRSIRALIDEVERCEALGIGALVVHPGSHMGAGTSAGIGNIAGSLNEVVRSTKGLVARICLETTAGQGSSIGHDIAELGRIIGSVESPERLGVCLDTCHLFAAGYDLRNREAYERTIDLLIGHVGLGLVRCVHTNDSRGRLGSRLDRHEHIGKGALGRAGFVHLLNDPRLAGVPRILETPKGTNGRGVDLDRVNLAKLRRIAGVTIAAAGRGDAEAGRLR